MRDGPAPEPPPPRRRQRSSGKKRIRLDPHPNEGEAPRAPSTDAGLLDRFRGWLNAPPRECRSAARHAARTYLVWLGWWHGENEFFALTARLSNISRGGALILVEQPPPENHPVWICLGTPEPDECLAATVLEVRRARRREYAIRLAFRAPCPSRFLEAAVCGRATTRAGIGHP